MSLHQSLITTPLTFGVSSLNSPKKRAGSALLNHLQHHAHLRRANMLANTGLASSAPQLPPDTHYLPAAVHVENVFV